MLKLIMDEIAVENYEAIEKNNIPRVVEVQQNTFNKLVKKLRLRRKVEINMGRWDMVSGKNVLNEGAAPCLIIYMYDRKHQKMILSGHFPEADRERANRRIMNEVGINKSEVPRTNDKKLVFPLRKSEIDHYSNTRLYDEGYERFEKMLEYISDVTKEVGKDKIDIFLFGQNLGIRGTEPKRSQDIVKNTIEQHNVVNELTRVGVTEMNIHDYRRPNQAGVDDTFYVYGENTIYRSRR